MWTNKNLKYEAEHPYISKINVNDLTKQTYLNTDFQNKQIFKSYKNSLVYLNIDGLGIFDVNTLEKKLFKIGDKFDNKIVLPKDGSINSTLQYDREFRNLLIDNDTIFITSKAREIDQAQLLGSTPYIHIANSWNEIWKFNQNNFTLMYRDSISLGVSSAYPLDFIKYKNDAFVLSSNKTFISKGSSLYKITSSFKWENLPEVDSIKAMAEANCTSVLSIGNRLYVKYLSSTDRLVNDVVKKYGFVPAMFVVYENDKPIDAMPISLLNLDGAENAIYSNPNFDINPLIYYKGYIFLVGLNNIYIYKNNKLSIVDINNGKGLIGVGANPKLALHGQVLINEKGIYIINRDSTYNYQILYNRDIEGIIASTGIDNEIDTKEYINIINKNINFIQQADSYTIYDLNGKILANKVNPNLIEPLPEMGNGIYFILAQYGNTYYSSKILITK